MPARMARQSTMGSRGGDRPSSKSDTQREAEHTALGGDLEARMNANDEAAQEMGDMDGVMSPEEVRLWPRNSAPRLTHARRCLCIDRHFRVRWLRCLQFLEAFDTDQDGVISKDEWEAGKKQMALQYHNALEINIDKLTTR